MEVVGSLSKRWKVVNGVVVAQSERDFTQGPSALPLVPGAPTSAATATTAAAAPKVASGGAGGGAGAGAGAGASAASAAAEVVKQYKKSVLDLETRFQLCRSVGQECEKEAELRALLAAKDHPICYDGFEPSGRMHIAQGIMKAINVNKLTQAGCVFKFWIADWFALLNKKMGGDIKKIRDVGEYMIEVWKAAGMDMTNVEFIWCSDTINANSNEYWLQVMDIATRFSLTRMKRCGAIMGRKESDDLAASQIMYPAMQCADVFFLKADICQLGMDQRKVNMLAREYCDKIKRKFKPVILGHHMLMGLQRGPEGAEKMSKSVPGSAIFMDDSVAEVNSKIKKAFCPPADDPGAISQNPIMDWVRHIVFAKNGQFELRRRDSDGGPKVYATMEEVEADYLSGALHPGDLKNSLKAEINAMLEPVRQHFKQPKLKKLLAKVKKYRSTR